MGHLHLVLLTFQRFFELLHFGLEFGLGCSESVDLVAAETKFDIRRFDFLAALGVQFLHSNTVSLFHLLQSIGDVNVMTSVFIVPLAYQLLLLQQ